MYLILSNDSTSNPHSHLTFLQSLQASGDGTLQQMRFLLPELLREHFVLLVVSGGVICITELLSTLPNIVIVVEITRFR